VACWQLLGPGHVCQLNAFIFLIFLLSPLFEVFSSAAFGADVVEATGLDSTAVGTASSPCEQDTLLLLST